MAGKYNGNGPKYCKNCGGMEGVHQSETDRCPNRGEDQTGLNPPIWQDTTFDPQDWEWEIEKPTKPADMERLPLNQEIKLEERTLFDDYYLAALQGVATIMGNCPPKRDEVEEAIEIIPIFAREIAVQAIKNRATYLYGGYKE